MQAEYQEFLATKRPKAQAFGLTAVPPLHSGLHPHARDSTAFALRKGRAALFLSTGLAKTSCQIEWGRVVHEHTGGDVLILAPLAVSAQTIREARDRWGVKVTRCDADEDIQPGLNITNYERLEKLNPTRFAGVVLDESSILKNLTGATKRLLCSWFEGTTWRLCCTATPSPNDYMELGNHAEFLGIMSPNEMLQRWFINDTSTASQDWRLKRHGVEDFWDWVCSWAICLHLPSDMGHSDTGFVLPPLKEVRHIIRADLTIDSGETLFRMPIVSATGLHREKRLTASDRAAQVASIVRAQPRESWLIWCATNYEADCLREALPEADEVRGSETAKRKEQAALDFVDGRTRVLVSKPGIFGFGLNFQHCARVAFIGVDYSFEAYYQAIRRVWRFGQTRSVEVHIVMGENEAVIWDTIRRKADQHEKMRREMFRATKRAMAKQHEVRLAYDPRHKGRLPSWLAA